MELLEEQQKRMSSGLRRMYKRLKDKGLWEGNVLIETDQSPSIVDILAELDLIEPPEDDESVTMSDEEMPPKEESTPTFSPKMCISHGDINVTGVDSQAQPRDTPQGTEPLDTIDWDMAMVFTPLPITPSFTQDNYARPDLNPCSCSLRDYSNQIFDAQAQQANLGVSLKTRLYCADHTDTLWKLLAPITDLPTSSRYLQHSF